MPQGLRQLHLVDVPAAARPSYVRGPGKAIDVLAIIATLFGSATSLGLGALQITGGLDDVFGGGGDSKLLAVVVIAVLAACFVLSAVSGVHRGVKYLSNANAVAAALLAFFLFVVGPSVFILGTFTDGMGSYLTQLPHMSFTTGVYDGTVSIRLNGWTIFYWAWWISWTPFVGMFIARISKGRTIRQFVWFAILRGAALDLQFWGLTTGAVAAVLLWAGGLSALQTLVILVAGPFMLVLIGMCVSLLKALRTEPFESRLPSRVRTAVQHAERFSDGP